MNNGDYGKDQASIQYWIHHRSQLADLYKSESYFLVDEVKTSKNVLDVGCAAGGAALFLREANSNVEYFGIDISENMIEAARVRFEHKKYTTFAHFDGINIPFKEQSMDFCFSLGVFHHVPDWQRLAREMLRVSQNSVLFDVRAWELESIVNSSDSYQKLALAGQWDGKSTVPYNIFSFNELFGFLNLLKAEGIGSKVYGYYGKPTELAVTPAKTVAMLSVLLIKNEASPTIILTLE